MEISFLGQVYECVHVKSGQSAKAGRLAVGLQLLHHHRRLYAGLRSPAALQQEQPDV